MSSRSPSAPPNPKPRRRALAAFAALALVALSAAGPLAGPADPAYAVTAFTITTPGQVTTAPQLDVSGTVDWEAMNGDIELRGVVGGTQYCGDYAYFEVDWDCFNVPLEIGDNVLTVYALVDVGGSIEETAGPTITITRGGTEAVGVVVPVANSVHYGDFDVSGTGPALGTVSVVDVPTTTTLCTSAVALDGTWSCTATAPANGGTTLRADAYAVDSGSAVSSTDSVAITSNPVRPTISVTPGNASLAASSTDTSGAAHSIQFNDIDDGDPTEYLYGPAMHSCTGTGSPSSAACTLSGLAPGLWVVTAAASSYQDVWAWIPQTPTISSQLLADRRVQFSGTAEAGTSVTVQRLDGVTTCTALADASGSWSCTAAPAVGTASYRAFARSVDFLADSGGMTIAMSDAYVTSIDGISEFSASVAATVPRPPAAVGAPASAPLAWSFTLSGGEEGYLPGDEVVVTAQDLPEGTVLSVELHSTPILLGSVVAGADGIARLVASIPDDAEPGAHEFVVTITAPGQEPSTLTQATTIRALPPVEDDAEVVALDTTQAEAPVPRQTSVDRSDPAAPTALSDALPRPARFFEQPILLAIGGGLAIALLFLVALPTELLNAALAGNSSRLGRGFARLDTLSQRARDGFLRLARSRALATAILLLLVSFVFGFSDPAFGFDLASLRLVLALAIALFVLTYGVGYLTGLIAKRTWDAESAIEFQPSMLVFAVLGVVLGRLLDFSPGFLIGVVIGLELVRATRRAALGVSLLQFGLVVALATVAWLGHAALSGQPIDDFGTALLADTLAAVTVEGLTGAVVAILPLRFLDGRDIWTASRALWAVTFAVVALAFALLVLPTAMEGTEVSDVGVWLAVLGGFAVLTLAVWWFFARADAREQALAAGEERERVDV